MSLMLDLERQRERLATLPVAVGGDINKEVEVKLATFASQISFVESQLSQIQSAKVVEKVAQIDKALEGDVSQLLSVPLLRSKVDNFQGATEKELLKLEKNIEKLESSLNFFVTTTVTLTLGIFTAVLAPFFISFIQRRAAQRPQDESGTPNKQVQPTQ